MNKTPQDLSSRIREIREENMKDMSLLLVRLRAEMGEEKWSQLDKKYRERFARLLQDKKPPEEQQDD